jgi:hypothetical protein
MPYPDWSPDEIAELQKLTRKSGRILEVRTGNLFATRGWLVHLSTYYVDLISQKPRELDVLAHRREVFQVKGHQCELRFNVMVSCKRAGPIQNGMRQFAVELGRYLAGSVDTNPNRHLLGLKVFERKGTSFDFVRDRDNELYEGADSALKAAVWHYDQRARFDVEIALPIVVLDKKITHIPIGATDSESPTMCDRSYLAGLYPFGGLGNEPTWLLTLVWSAEELDELIKLLDGAVNYAQRKLSDSAMDW